MYSAHAVEELLTCSICLERLTQPKMLPCQHTFCLSCLMSLRLKPPGCITCPECRKVHRIPAGGMKNFSENLIVNNLLSLPPVSVEKLKVSPKCGGCKKEVSKEGDLCKDCTEDPRIAIVDKINCKVAMMKSHFSDPTVASSLSKNKGRLTKLSENLKVEQDKMNRQFEVFIQALGNRKDETNSVFDRGTEIMKLVAGSNQVDLDSFCKAILDKVAAKPSVAELELLASNCEKYLYWLKLICEMIGTNEEFQMQWFMPLTSFPSKQGDGLDVDKMVEFLSSMNALYHGNTAVDEPSQASGLRADRDARGRRQVNPPVHAQNGINPNEERAPQEQGAVGGLPPTSIPSEASLNPKQKPPPKQSNDCAGVNLRPIYYPSKIMTQPKILTGGKRNPVHHPFCVVYIEPTDQIAVTEFRNRLILMKSDGSNKYPFFVSPEMIPINATPNGLAYSRVYDLLYISDSQNSRILCGDMRGFVKYQLGSHGRGKDKFTALRGITCYSDYILAVDEENNRVSIFRITPHDGKFVRNFGQKHLVEPKNIAIGPKDDIYVTDVNGIQVFDWNGRFIRSFGETYDDDLRPWGIVVDRQGYTCVSRPAAHRLDVYHPDGEFYLPIEMCLAGPKGIALTPDGRIIVCNAEADRIVVI